MKKFSSLILTFSLLFVITSCAQNTANDNSYNTTIPINSFHETEANSKEPLTINDTGGGELTLQKYRSIYYTIPSPFWDVVDENSRDDIYGEYWEQPYSEINIMRMRIFVEEYNVPREKFDAANAEWARIVKEKLYGSPVINPQDYANQEFDEIYNADIIYTFDNEIINEYYLSHDYPYCYESEYEEAVASGEYTSKTEKWIDIEQMEAEIIAKYGEAEIVAETTTAEESSTIADNTTILEETTA
ncbi:MAG: hypothetical protein IJO03_09535 [Clostridia bacterium]|nr:hypothetical protein [Clostridia bacterium]